MYYTLKPLLFGCDGTRSVSNRQNSSQTKFLAIFRELTRKSPETPILHHCCVIAVHTEGVFKYDYCTLNLLSVASRRLLPNQTIFLLKLKTDIGYYNLLKTKFLYRATRKVLPLW